MFDEKALKSGFNRGDSSVLLGIYQKYKDDMLKLAVALLHDEDLAQDVLNDSFVALARLMGRTCLRGNLRGYLATCVANHARNAWRARRNKRTVSIEQAADIEAPNEGPGQSAILSEEYIRAQDAMAKLPYEQREVIVMRLRNSMKFREIARMQTVSINTCMSRYRCGLDKLRSRLNSEV